MRVQALDGARPWGEYLVTSSASGRTYRVAPLRSGPVGDAADLLRRVRRLEQLGHAVTVYPDAEEYLQEQLFCTRIRALVDEIRADPSTHPLRKELLAVELLPYQLDGIAFAAGAGRAILADERGSARRCRASGWPSCSAARRASSACWWSAPPPQVPVASRDRARHRRSLPARSRPFARAGRAVPEPLLLHDRELRAGVA
jgi:hypothetical protein